MCIANWSGRNGDKKNYMDMKKKAILRTYHATGGKVNNSLMHRSVESYEKQ